MWYDTRFVKWNQIIPFGTDSSGSDWFDLVETASSAARKRQEAFVSSKSVVMPGYLSESHSLWWWWRNFLFHIVWQLHWFCTQADTLVLTQCACLFQHVIRGNRPIKAEMAHQLYVLQVLTFNLLEERMMTKMDPNDQVKMWMRLQGISLVGWSYCL